jgi:LacI family repressor for deo operon, udp, cdd, tsx, nupC, and nupG
MTIHLKDIAAYTGVSIKTVSNVVNGNYARVSEKKRAQVLEAIEKLNYRPNIAARQLRKARTGVLALALPDLSNPYFMDIASVVIEAAREQGYTTLIDHTRGDLTDEALIIQGLRPHLIDGVILDPQSLGKDELQPDQVNVPIVLLGERIYESTCDHVMLENIAASRLATEHLLSLGRQRIAILGAREQSSCESPFLRLEGFQQAMHEAGQKIDAQYLVHCATWHRADGAAAMRYLLTLDTPPDAVFCFNDLMALGAMSVIHEAGYRIPEDIAVIGFDDIEDGHFSYPTLTTIAPDKGEIARQAVSLLLDRINATYTGEARLVNVPFHLCSRQSTLGRQADTATIRQAIVSPPHLKTPAIS